MDPEFETDKYFFLPFWRTAEGVIFLMVPNLSHVMSDSLTQHGDRFVTGAACGIGTGVRKGLPSVFYVNGYTLRGKSSNKRLLSGKKLTNLDHDKSEFSGQKPLI